MGFSPNPTPTLNLKDCTYPNANGDNIFLGYIGQAALNACQEMRESKLSTLKSSNASNAKAATTLNLFITQSSHIYMYIYPVCPSVRHPTSTWNGWKFLSSDSWE